MVRSSFLGAVVMAQSNTCNECEPLFDNAWEESVTLIVPITHLIIKKQHIHAEKPYGIQNDRTKGLEAQNRTHVQNNEVS